MNNVVIARPQPTVSLRSSEERRGKQSRALWDGIAALALRLARNDTLEWLAALAGFLLSLQTVWILRPGVLGGVSHGASAAWGVPWPLATIGVFPGDIILIIGAAICAHHFLRRNTERHISYAAAHEICHPRWSGGSAMILTIAIASVAIVNTAVSADPALSAVGWLRIILFLLALVGIPLWPMPARRAFLGGFLVAMVGHAAIGFWQFATLEAQPSTLLGIAAHNAWTLGDSVVTTGSERWLRAYGGFPHPNVFGAALLVALIGLAAAGHGDSRAAGLPTPPNPPSGEGGKDIFFSPHIGRGSDASPVASAKGERGWCQLLLTSYFLLLTSALVLTFSRAAFLGFVVLLVVLVVRRATRSLAAIGAVTALAIGITLWPLIAPRFSTSTPNEQRSLFERRTAFADTAHLLRTPRPCQVSGVSLPRSAHRGCQVSPKLFGTGLHTMPRALVERQPDRDPYTAQPIHNVPLLALVEVGVVGVLVLVLVLVFLFRHSFLFTLHSSLLLLPLLPPLLLDHHLWSLPIGLALVFVLAVALAVPASEQPRSPTVS